MWFCLNVEVSLLDELIRFPADAEMMFDWLFTPNSTGLFIPKKLDLGLEIWFASAALISWFTHSQSSDEIGKVIRLSTHSYWNWEMIILDWVKKKSHFSRNLGVEGHLGLRSSHFINLDLFQLFSLNSLSLVNVMG